MLNFEPKIKFTITVIKYFIFFAYFLEDDKE